MSAFAAGGLPHLLLEVQCEKITSRMFLWSLETVFPGFEVDMLVPEHRKAAGAGLLVREGRALGKSTRIARRLSGFCASPVPAFV